MSSRQGWALLLSGGASMGAVQVPVIEHLWQQLGPPALLAGVSVGAVNALALSDGDVAGLRAIWEEVDGMHWFQHPQADVWNGFYSLHPLRRQIEQRGKGANMRIPVVVGVVDPATQQYHSIALAGLGYHQRVDATICSATEPMVHERAQYDGRWYVDGGVEHVLPLLPDWQRYERIAAIFCSPLHGARRKPRTQEEVAQAWEQGTSTLEMLLSRVVNDDFKRLQEWAQHVPVVAYAPESWEAVGSPFDAEPATIRHRFATGAAMAQHPVLGAVSQP